MINEALSSVLFYYTNLKSATQIIKDNQVNLTPTFKNDSEMSVGQNKLFFMSLTRSRQGSYHREKDNGVIFELDGDKLSTRYGGKAVDYWPLSLRDGPDTDEMEDRLYTDKPTIKILNYTKSVSVVFSTKYNQNVEGYVVAIFRQCKKSGIPVYVYDNSKDWIQGNKKNALTIDDIKALKKDIAKPYQSRHQRRSPILALIELYHKNSTEHLSKEASELLRTMRYDDYIKPLSADIHNESGFTGDGASENVRKLAALIKKSGNKDFKTFAEKIREKWATIKKNDERTDFLRRNRKLIKELISLLEGKSEIDLSLFNDSKEDVKHIIRNLIHGMKRYNVFPDILIDRYTDLNDEDISGYRLDSIISGVTHNILKQVGMEDYE